MKSILTTFLLLTSLNTFAATPEDVCKSLTFDSDKLKCLEIISQGYIDTLAADVCKSMSFGSSATECLEVSLDKVYRESEVAICKSFSFDSDKVDCMSKAGEKYYGGRTCSEDLSFVGSLTSRAIKKLERGKYRQALRILDRVVRITDK